MRSAIIFKIPKFSLNFTLKLPIKPSVFLQPVGYSLIRDTSGNVSGNSAKIFICRKSLKIVPRMVIIGVRCKE